MSLQSRRALIGEAMAVSQEAIAYQGKSMFFQDLTFAFQNYIAGGRFTQQAMDSLNLAGIVQKHTGLNIEFRVEPGEYNAYAAAPIIDPNSPLLDRYREMGLNHTSQMGDALLTFRKVTSFTKELRGSIDRANGRVSGVFSKILTSVAIGTGLWEVCNMTAEEVAAVCLHEIGHVFTFFECLMQTATTNMVLASANQALAQSTEMEHRLQLVFETEQILGTKIEDKEALARPGIKPEAFNTVFIKAMMDPNLRSTAGSHTYDLRSCEFIADQFAARYGAARALVVALDKMYAHSGGHYRRSLSAHIAIEGWMTAMRILALVLFPVVLGALYAVATMMFLVFVANESHIYDLPDERLSRLRGDVVQSMKDPKLPAKVREKLVADLATIDKVSAGVESHRTLMDYLWIAVTSKRRAQYSQMRFQQEIERLVNNDFFVKANQLKNLA